MSKIGFVEPVTVHKVSCFNSLPEAHWCQVLLCGAAGVNVPIAAPCLRHNSSIKGRIALENRWDLMIAPRPGLIDWMISSLSRLALYLLHSLPPLVLSLLTLRPITSTLPAALTLSPSIHQFLSQPFPTFTGPFSRSHCALLRVSSSDYLQIFTILISTNGHSTIITGKSAAKIRLVCFHNFPQVAIRVWQDNPTTIKWIE